jgi:heat shock protein HslJ
MKSTLLIVSIAAIAIAFSLLLAACVAPPAATPAPTPAAAAASAAVEETATSVAEAAPAETGLLPVEALKNATYSGIYDGPVTLTEGLYEGEPIEGDPARPTIEYVDGAELQGDLDGDGTEDAVVFLVERGGGSGVFTYVAAQLNRAGQPVDAGAVRIEDRIQVKSATLEDGQVTLDIITQGPGDVACCGTHQARKTYALQEGQLVETTGEGGDLVKVSATELDGTSWTLLERNGDQPALADSEVTINFGDGEVAGSGGCNSYTGSFSPDEVNPFVMGIGPVAATRQACPDPAGSQETAYFTALENVSHRAYGFGRLALYYQDARGEQGRLLFAPWTAPELTPPPTEDLMMLRAHPWQWISFSDPMETFAVENPTSYRLSFNPDASLAITADCNNVMGFYQGESGLSLSISIGPATLAECGPGSRSDQFVRLLGGAAKYFFRDGKLYIDLMADGGTMAFTPAGEAAATPGGTSAAAAEKPRYEPLAECFAQPSEGLNVDLNNEGPVTQKLGRLTLATG